MSAFLAMLYSDRVEILSDAARQRSDGGFESPRRKVWTSVHCPIAITGRGNYALIEGVAGGLMTMAESRSVDRVLAAFKDVLAVQRAGGITEMPAEFLIAGFSEEHGPIALYIAGSGDDAFRPQSVDELAYGGPAVDIAGIARLDRGLRAPSRYVFEHIRRAPGGDAVGGWLDLTTVAADGCAVEQVHVW